MMDLEDLLGYEDDDIIGDESGYDEIGYDEIGRRIVRSKRPVPARPGTPGRLKLSAPAASTLRSAGAQKMALKRVPIGLGGHTFAFGGATSFTFEVEPQRDYQAERMVLDVTRSSSTVSEGVRVTSIDIGDIEQLPSGEGVPAACFRPDTTYSALDLSTCKAGTKLRVTVELSDALESTESISVECGFFGKVVGQ